MFEVASEFMVQLVSFIPVYFALYILFDLIGTLLFGKK